ncbi:MAG TPA: hypothetical protein VIO94_11325 [Phenylobacterium sp.]
MDAPQHWKTCPPEVLRVALATAGQDDEAGLQAVDQLLVDYQSDPTLHFLRGSVLASLRRYGDAEDAMRRSLSLDPSFDIARFQLGFLQYSSGDPQTAQQTWLPLDERPPTNPLRLFATGLVTLARDQLREGIDLLKDGMARNTDVPPLNRDMQLIIDGLEELQRQTNESQEPVSSAQFLLQQSAAKRTMH